MGRLLRSGMEGTGDDQFRGTSLDRRRVLDVTPRQVQAIAGTAPPERYRRRLAGYGYGPGAFKVDWALDGPIPWTAKECARAGTVHSGGTLDEIAFSEETVWRAGHSERPYVLLA